MRVFPLRRTSRFIDSYRWVHPAGAPKDVPLGYIHRYVEDVKRVSNADLGPKDFLG